MVRRTKEESLETRRAIIAAARAVFNANGVTRTSLEQIAAAAGVTRGAIYWHFADKTELFYAMRDEVKIPMVDRSDLALEMDGSTLDPLQKIGRFLSVVVEQMAGDPATLTTFEIMTFKCEYVGAFARDLDMTCEMHGELRDKLAKQFREALRLGILRSDTTPQNAALDTLVFMAGLIRTWLVDRDGTLVRKHALRLIVDHIEAKRAAPAAPTTAMKRARRAVSRVAPK